MPYLATTALKRVTQAKEQSGGVHKSADYWDGGDSHNIIWLKLVQHLIPRSNAFQQSCVLYPLHIYSRSDSQLRTAPSQWQCLVKPYLVTKSSSALIIITYVTKLMSYVYALSQQLKQLCYFVDRGPRDGLSTGMCDRATTQYVAKASTASSACWQHNVTVGAVYSPVWAWGEGHHQPAISWWCMPVHISELCSSCSICTLLYVVCWYAQFALHT